MVTISAGAGGTSTVASLFDNKKSTQYQSSGNNDDTTSTVITIDLDATQTISHIVLRNHNLKDFHMQHEEGTTLGTLWLGDNGTDLIYNLGQAGTVISSFSTPAGNPYGLAIFNGNFNNSAIYSTNNSATSSFFSFDTITTKRIRLTANKTITANEEKKVGDLLRNHKEVWI